MVEVMHSKVARTESTPKKPRVAEHPRVASAQLARTPTHSRPEHGRGHGQRPHRLQQLAADDPGLPVERDVLHVAQHDPCLPQAMLDGVVWKAAVVLAPGEALLFDSRDHVAIADQRGSGVTERGQAEDVQGNQSLKFTTAARSSDAHALARGSPPGRYMKSVRGSLA